MRSVESEGATIEQAVEQAVAQLGVGSDEVDVEVLSEKGRSFLGFGRGGSVRVKVTVKESPRERAEALVVEILRTFDPKARVKTREEDDHTLVEIEGDDLGLLIGRHGQTLDALQYLVNLGANRGRSENRRRFVVDIEGYRKRREEDLIDLARRVAGKVAATRNAVTLRPMTAFERRVVHVALQPSDEVETLSEGEEPDRKITVMPKAEA